MKDYIFFADSYIKFEADMIKNSGIKEFITFTESTSSDDTLIILDFQTKTTQKTVAELMEIRFYHGEKLIQLIKALIHLETLCEHYLLDIEHVDFSPSAIHFDMQHQGYSWTYIPCKAKLSNFRMLDLIRDLLIETYSLEAGYFLGSLQEKSLNLEEIIRLIQSKISTAHSQATFLQRFVRRKSIQALDLPRQTTVHNPSYPILLNKSDPSESYKLYFELNTIGRDESCNIFVREQSISRKHAIVYRENQQYKVKDLSSTNGTLLNNQPISCDTPIVNGDNLQIGEKEFIFIR